MSSFPSFGLFTFSGVAGCRAGSLGGSMLQPSAISQAPGACEDDVSTHRMDAFLQGPGQQMRSDSARTVQFFDMTCRAFDVMPDQRSPLPRCSVATFFALLQLTLLSSCTLVSGLAHQRAPLGSPGPGLQRQQHRPRRSQLLTALRGGGQASPLENVRLRQRCA